MIEKKIPYKLIQKQATRTKTQYFEVYQAVRVLSQVIESSPRYF